MLLQISTLKFWINLEPLDYFRLIGTARGGRSDQPYEQCAFARRLAKANISSLSYNQHIHNTASGLLLALICRPLLAVSRQPIALFSRRLPLLSCL